MFREQNSGYNMAPSGDDWVDILQLEIAADRQLEEGMDAVVGALAARDGQAYTLALNQTVLAGVARHGLMKLRAQQAPEEWGWVATVQAACTAAIGRSQRKYGSLRSTQLFSDDVAVYRQLRRSAYASCEPPKRGEPTDLPDAIVMGRVVAAGSFNR